MSEFDIQRQHRFDKIEQLKRKGINPYTNDFRPSARIPEILEKYKNLSGESESTENISIAGRLMGDVNGEGSVRTMTVDEAAPYVERIYGKVVDTNTAPV